MAAKKVGVLVKEARTAAGLTQEKLAKAAGENLTAAMIGKCERGEDDLSTAQLKKIAVACGVTQASLINAPKNLSAAAKKKLDAAKKEAAAKTAAKAKTTTASKTASATKKTTAKKPASTGTVSPDGVSTTAKAKTAAKTTAKPAAKPAAASAEKLTAAEKTLLETYRSATATLKKAALKLLQGEYGKDPDKALKGSSSAVQDGIQDVLGDVLSGLFNK